MSKEVMSVDGCESMAGNLNWNFVAHILKDVFNPVSPVVTYGTGFELIEILRGPEFGIETWGLYSHTVDDPIDYSFYWEIGYNDSHFGQNFCNLFVSFDYNLELKDHMVLNAVSNIHRLMEDNAFLCIPDWTDKLLEYFEPRPDMIKELRRYSILQDKEISVYQKVS